MSSQYPKISIITPSYNQVEFIEETILSVLNQDYPNIEYIIIDGGSTDGTVEIIKKYSSHLHYWVSEKDNGQAEAINKGFSFATGDILGWINSDDFYLDGSFEHAVDNLQPENPEILFGNCIQKIETWDNKCIGSNTYKSFLKTNIFLHNPFPQSSSFWTKKAWEKLGGLDENYHYAFDWLWFLKHYVSGTSFRFTNNYLSVYRLHQNHKTGKHNLQRQNEICNIINEYADSKYVNAYRYLCKKKPRISKINRILNRIHLSFLSQLFLPVIFPKLICYGRKTITTLLAMV